MASAATFYTVTDARYFTGTVALLNSLRLVGHTEELVVLDNGLAPAQRRRLAEHATIVDKPADLLESAFLVKAFPRLLGVTGTIAIIDSDMIVTASLAPAFARAEAGQICMHPDHWGEQDRWFAEWEQAFQLGATLRHQTYLNSGFVTFSVDHWPDLLERWWKACERIPEQRKLIGEAPFKDHDQDPLNAILMSEVAASSVAILPEWEAIYGGFYDAGLGDGVEIVDETHLRCLNHGRPVSILHHVWRPKVWSDSGVKRMRWGDTYVRLFPRVVLAEDVALRLDVKEVPWWLRQGPSTRFAMWSLGAVRLLRNRVGIRERMLGMARRARLASPRRSS